jgi:hypothetical protein
MKCIFLLTLLIGLQLHQINSEDNTPSVQVTILVRNKAHELHYFLSYFEDLVYDKKKISLW